MRNWNTPAILDLDVRMTASSGNPSTNEAGGYLNGNSWVQPTFPSSVYEDNGDCVIPVKAGAQS